MAPGGNAPTSRKRVCLVSEQESTFGRRLTRGIIEYARRHPHLGSVTQDISPFTQGTQLPDTKLGRTIVLTYHAEQAALLNRLGIPLVKVSRMAFEPPLQTVCTDNVRIGQLAAAHLIERGPERFMFVGRTPRSHDLLRLEGFQKTLAGRRFRATSSGCRVKAALPTDRLTSTCWRPVTARWG